MQDPPSVLIRGGGSIGTTHARVLTQRLGVTDLAVWPVRERAAGDTGLGEARVVGQHAGTDAMPAVVVVATDSGRHVCDTYEAIDRGARVVLVEKPVALTAAPLAALRRHAEQRGSLVFGAAPLRFRAALQAFRHSLPQVGTVHAVDVVCRSYLPTWRPGRDHRLTYSARADEGGVLRDLIHEVDYAVWLFGPPSSVLARTRNTGRLDVQAEELAHVLWAVPGGAEVTVQLDYISPVTSRTLTAHGDGGRLHWDGLGHTVTWTAAGRPAEVTHYPDDHQADAVTARQDAALLALVDGGTGEVLPTLAEAELAIAICDAARESALHGGASDVTAVTP
ncbi:N/A [soil metagenome]